MFFVLIVTLYTTRVVLNTLGIEDYGIYNVVAGFVSLFGFLNATLSSSMQRFYNYELGRNGQEGIARVYITGLYVHLIIAAIVFVLLESFGLWYVNNVMVVPEDRLTAANILFQVAIISMLLIIIQIPFIGIIMAYERMNFYALVGILDVVLKLAIVLILPFINHDKLIIYSLLFSLVSVINFILYFTYAKIKLLNDIKTDHKFDKKLLKEMASFSGWNLVGTFAFMLRGQGINMVLNYFFGPVVNAARGVAFQVNSGVMGFSRNIVTAFSPQLTSSYAKGDIKRSILLMFTESKVCFALIAMLITPLMFEMDLVLNLWIGKNVPQYSKIFTVLVLVDSLVCVLNTPCTQIVFASGKLKKYQIGSSIVNLLLIPTACVVLVFRSIPETVFYLTIAFSIINQIVCLYFANKEVKFGLNNYFRKVLLPCSLYILIIPLIPYLLCHIMTDSTIRLLIVCISSMIISILIAYCLLLDRNEKVYVKGLIKQKISCRK